MQQAHWVVCGRADMVANSSARAPRPAALRAAGGSSLPLRAARFAGRRATAVVAASSIDNPQSQQPSSRPNVAAKASASDLLRDTSSKSASGNGGARMPRPDPSPLTMTVHGGEQNGRLRQGAIAAWSGGCWVRRPASVCARSLACAQGAGRRSAQRERETDAPPLFFRARTAENPPAF
jgi:hypothetical protein